MTLRTRVVLAAALSILLAVAVLGAGVEVLVGRHLHASLDRTLRGRAADVARLAVSAPALLTTPGALDSPLGGRELSVEVLDRHGHIVSRSLALGGRLLPQGAVISRALASGRPGYENATLGGEHLRVYAAPLADVGGQAAGGVVIVATSTSELDDTLDRVREFAVLSGLAAAGLAAVAAALLMRRALGPLRRLSGAAAEIERTGDHQRRLPEPDAHDEVGELGATLNAMLGSLERARDRERQFVADASHELRTPLTALQGNVAYVARHGAAPSDEVLADLEADIRRMGALIQDLLTLSREDAGEPPSDVVRLDELARGADTDDGDVVVEAPGPVRVRGDRDALERALANLLENARRHGPPNGRITVRAEQQDGTAQLSVRDEGDGLGPDEAELAFGRFWRRDHRAEGSGLGLAIVRATAERHGGRATVDGSCFTIELPALRELSESGARTDAAQNR
jgi:two-component system OmpR family sensor kinase